MGQESMRKKKPPERLRPRGAEDTGLFRERLDATPSWAEQISLGGVTRLFSEAAASSSLGRSGLRGPQEGGRLAASLPRADPSTRGSKGCGCPWPRIFQGRPGCRM